jgi:hypothetical protein
MNGISGFQGVAPYLKDPLVLIGFVLLLAFLFSRYLLKRNIIKPLPTAFGYRILRSILLYGFIIAILIIILGFALRHQELVNRQRAASDIELMLRDVLNNRSSLPEGKKNEIINQILNDYRSGALSKEQIETWIEEVKSPSTQTFNNISEAGSSQNQVNPGDSSEKDTNNPLLSDTVLGTTNKSVIDYIPYAANQTQNTQIGGSPTNDIKNPLILIGPFESALQTCAVNIDWPSNGAMTGRWSYVTGTVKLPANHHLLVLVRFGINKWQRGRQPTIDEEGKWKVTVRLGKNKELGVFDIAAVVVDEQTMSDVKNGVKTLDSANISFGCALATTWVSKRQPEDPPLESLLCANGRTVTCDFAATCDCRTNRGCIGYDEEANIVEIDFCHEDKTP